MAFLPFLSAVEPPENFRKDVPPISRTIIPNAPCEKKRNVARATILFVFYFRGGILLPSEHKKDVRSMLGARIAALRRDAGWSQAELGQRLRVSASAVGMYEQGRREPSADTIVALSEIFEVTTDYLLKGRPVDMADQQAVARLMRQSLQSAQTALTTRPSKPFNRNELAALFAAMLTDA
jgi:transcriptional regulator with XRE-family HTH domain